MNAGRGIRVCRVRQMLDVAVPTFDIRACSAFFQPVRGVGPGFALVELPVQGPGRSLLPDLRLQGRVVTAEGSFEVRRELRQPLHHIGPHQFGLDITSWIDFVS
jgi:hypothetical protein